MKLNLAVIDKRVIRHIKAGGKMRDPEGMKLAMEVADTALRDPNISGAAASCSFDRTDLAVAYMVMVNALLPNPTIKAGGPMLAATLPFVEKARIVAFMEHVARDLPEGLGKDEWRHQMLYMAEDMALRIWEQHAAARGEAMFSVPDGSKPSKSSGCLVIVALIGVLPISIWMIEKLLN